MPLAPILFQAKTNSMIAFYVTKLYDKMAKANEKIVASALMSSVYLHMTSLYDSFNNNLQQWRVFLLSTNLHVNFTALPFTS